MTRRKFLVEYKKRKNIKNIETARENIDNFWNTIFEVLKDEKRIMFKDWGMFERKEVRSRRIVIPAIGEKETVPKTTIKFKAGKKLKNYICEEGGGDND